MQRKRVKGKLHTATFKTLHEAKKWRDSFLYISATNVNQFATLKEVWEVMQIYQFPLLVTSTREIWIRRYRLLKTIEHLPMNEITPGKISEWVSYWVTNFNTEEYQYSGRGKTGLFSSPEQYKAAMETKLKEKEINLKRLKTVLLKRTLRFI